MGAPLQTPLYDLHSSLGAKLVEFAGFSLPIQYPTGIIKEHLHTRAAAGLFDVSHMGQLVVEGAGAAAALEALLPVDLDALAQGQQCYTLLMNEQGGIVDDLILSRWSDDRFFLVVNASRLAIDLELLKARLPGLSLHHAVDKALLALQGPQACSVMNELCPGAERLGFMHGSWFDLGEGRCFVTRSGYTGEDGFEISVDAHDAEALARRLLAFDAVAPIGLGARDTLRLEAGLCLYGHDLNEDISPVGAGLGWSIAKARRAGGSKAGGFCGAERYFAEMQNVPERKRVGLFVDSRAPVREGALIVGADEREIGVVCSGGFSPSLERPIAMAYVDRESLASGEALHAINRGREVSVSVSKMPFVPQRYYRG